VVNVSGLLPTKRHKSGANPANAWEIGKIISINEILSLL
jgi:hypothetical protein